MSFPSSQMVTSCFTGNSLPNTGPNRSYIASTGIDGEPLRKHVCRGIRVTVVNHPAPSPYPLMDVQGEGVQNVLACATRPGRGLGTVKLEHVPG